MYRINHRPIIIFESLLTKEECSGLIDYMESQPRLENLRSGSAKYDRHILISNEWASKIYERIIKILPRGYCEEVSINDYFRFSKYHPGGYFAQHRDGLNQNREGKRTIMTVNIFLNDLKDDEGGETIFYDDKDPRTPSLSFHPKAGTGVIFDREILHMGNHVKSGNKYLFRTDVMM
jgi:Rps23 Pro-64 3,4-dihydroxylase Tpa1-like proline 4-hydroxylase